MPCWFFENKDVVEMKGNCMSENLKELNDDTYEQHIQSGVVLLDFWAPWCGPCQMLSPVLEQVAGDLAGKAMVAKISIDDSPFSAQALGVTSIPTLLVLKDGKEVKRLAGMQQRKALVKAVEEAL